MNGIWEWLMVSTPVHVGIGSAIWTVQQCRLGEWMWAGSWLCGFLALAAWRIEANWRS